MPISKILTTSYRDPEDILGTLKFRANKHTYYKRYAGLYNNGRHCDLNSVVGLLVAIGEEDKLISVIENIKTTNEDICTMKQTVEIAKKYLTTDIDMISEEEQKAYMSGICAMHRNGLYGLQYSLLSPADTTFIFEDNF